MGRFNQTTLFCTYAFSFCYLVFISNTMCDVELTPYEEYVDRYRRIEECGKGKFGKVFHVKSKDVGKCFASKHIRSRQREQKQKVLCEIRLLKKISHPQIVKFIEAFESFNEIIIVTEFLNGGELFDRIASEEFEITEEECCLFLRQICRGVEYLHKQTILHLDLKPENIVCQSKKSSVIKIIDFGLAKEVKPGQKEKTMGGTPEFVAPEIVNYDYVTTSTDMWAIGVITYILLSGFSPFMGENDAETFSNVVNVAYDFDEPEFDIISSNAKDFIAHLLMKNPRTRLTASQCLEHSWLMEEDIGTEILPNVKLRQFQARRKWQKFGQAIRTVTKISSMLDKRRSLRATASYEVGQRTTSLLNSYDPSKRHSFQHSSSSKF